MNAALLYTYEYKQMKYIKVCLSVSTRIVQVKSRPARRNLEDKGIFRDQAPDLFVGKVKSQWHWDSMGDHIGDPSGGLPAARTPPHQINK